MPSTCYEMRIDHEIYIFGSEDDAIAAEAAMLRGAKISSAEKFSGVIKPIETHVRRVVLAISDRKTEKALKQADRKHYDNKRALGQNRQAAKDIGGA